MPASSPEAVVVDMLTALYQQKYADMVNYAEILLRKAGVDADPDRAEEAVQEAFLQAWKKLDDFADSENPIGWLYNSVRFAVLTLRREEMQWLQRIKDLEPVYLGATLVSDNPDFSLAGMIPKEDYLFLKQYLLEGYSRKELAEMTGTTRQAVTMRIQRIKAQMRNMLI